MALNVNQWALRRYFRATLGFRENWGGFRRFALPPLLQNLVGEFFGNFRREIWREFDGIFLRPTKIKAQNFQGKFQSMFRGKFRGAIKIFRANFVLQTCHPNDLGPQRLLRK